MVHRKAAATRTRRDFYFYASRTGASLLQRGGYMAAWHANTFPAGPRDREIFHRLDSTLPQRKCDIAGSSRTCPTASRERTPASLTDLRRLTALKQVRIAQQADPCAMDDYFRS